MKCKNKHRDINIERERTARRRQEMRGGFKCRHCKRQVPINPYMGTANRSHCNICLWSRHADRKPGDRLANCMNGMKPIGLTFRIENNAGRLGEIMLIHKCTACDKASINRIAADDLEASILQVFYDSSEQNLQIREHLAQWYNRGSRIRPCRG